MNRTYESLTLKWGLAVLFNRQNTDYFWGKKKTGPLKPYLEEEMWTKKNVSNHKEILHFLIRQDDVKPAHHDVLQCPIKTERTDT